MWKQTQEQESSDWSVVCETGSHNRARKMDEDTEQSEPKRKQRKMVKVS